MRRDTYREDRSLRVARARRVFDLCGSMRGKAIVQKVLIHFVCVGHCRKQILADLVGHFHVEILEIPYLHRFSRFYVLLHPSCELLLK